MAELVQPVVLLRSGSHEDAIRCVAEASLRAYVAAPDLHEWQEWLSGIFTKTVRRAKPAEYEKAKGAGALVEVCHGDARALAFAPYPADALTGPIARLQVSGTELPRLGWGDRLGNEHVFVAINNDLDMSTGKAAAQAAHALWGIWLQLKEHDREHWVADDLVFRLESVDGENLALGKMMGAVLEVFGAELGARAYVAVHDAGRTEVEPGSLTAVGIFW